MVIVVGTESYISVADADAYWAARNNAAWAGAVVADKEKALRFATEYIDGAYDGRWIGEHPGGSAQPLAWPRNKAVDSEGRTVTGIPQRIADATARLALEALSEFLVSTEQRDGRIQRAKVGPLDVTYFADAAAGKSFPFLDLMLSGLLRNAGRGTGLVRV